MHDFGLIKARTAKGAIAQYRIVKHDGAAGTVALATTSTDPYDGVSGVRGTNEEGEWIDIYKDGIRPVEFGGSVVAGDPLTADAQGKAIKATAASGVNIRCIGWAEVSAQSGDIADVHIHQFIMQG